MFTTALLTAVHPRQLLGFSVVVVVAADAAFDARLERRGKLMNCGER